MAMESELESLCQSTPTLFFFNTERMILVAQLPHGYFHSPCLSELFIVVHADHLKLRLLAMLIHSGNNRTLN